MRTGFRIPIVALAVLAAAAAHPEAPSAPLSLGARAPRADVKMPGVDGAKRSIDDSRGTKGTLVVFTCNHCPYVKAWEERTVAIGNAALDMGVGVFAINANDPAVQPEDAYDEMKRRSAERGMNYPYVVDTTSEVARAFGATKTPEFFLFDAQGRLVYHGALDDNARDASKVEATWLSDALEALVAGREIEVKETKALGCSIKFRKAS